MLNAYEKFYDEAMDAFVQSVRPPRLVAFACYGAGASLAPLPLLTTGSRVVPAVYLLANVAAVQEFAGMPELSTPDHTDMHFVMRAALSSYHEACETISVISAPPEGLRAGIGEQTTIASSAGVWILTPPPVSQDTFEFLRTCQGVNHARLAHDKVVCATALLIAAESPRQPPGYQLQKSKSPASVD